jgi:hypothetical protein
MIMTREAPRLADRVPELAGPLSDLVARALAKDPEQRFRDAGEMFEALRAVQSGGLESYTIPSARLERRTRPNGGESLALSPAPANLELPIAALDAAHSRWRRPALYALLATLSLVALLAAARALSPSKERSEPRFIVVQADPRASQPRLREGGTGAPSGLTVSQLRPADPPVSAAPLRRANVGPNDAAAEALAQSFRAQRAGVVRCVNTFPREVEQSPKLSLRLSLDAQGAVSDAQLSPAQLAGTELSRCIESAARALRFPKQPGPIVFDVPLTARKGT